MDALRKSHILAAITALFLLSAGIVFGGDITKSFTGVKEIRIKTVSGDCIVAKGSGNEVKVEVQYTYDDRDFEAELEQRGDLLTLAERFFGHNNRGRSTWRLSVPDNVRIEFSTASGGFEASDLTSKIDAETASGSVTLRNTNGEVRSSTASGDVDLRQVTGDINIGTASGAVELTGAKGKIHVGTASGRVRAENIEGEIDIGTASGRVSINGASGELKVGTASGGVEAEGITLTARSEFSAASGDVEVGLAKSPEHDLKLSSASGDAILNFNANPVKGFISMTAKAGRGRIRAPFEFDDEETYYKWEDEYVTKTVTKGDSTPRIEISTASGIAELIEKK